MEKFSRNTTGRIRSYRFTPLLIAIGVVVGIVIGSFFASHFSGDRLNLINTSSDKLNSLLHIIDDQYVDTVNIPDLVEQSIPEMMKKLDPHSVYIPASDAEASMQELKGSFSGIGIQFMIYDDTINVVKVLKGGPSESVGLQAGDRIVQIDGKTYVGKDVNSDDTQKRLKGQAGTTVKLGIKRKGTNGLKTYSIVRGSVPIKSVDIFYMVDKTTGYIRINSFGDTTQAEFLAALATLNSYGFERLIIDLRGNLGGYMAPAVQIANEFLPKGRLIVYTQGRKSPKEEFKSDGRGSYQNIPLVVLVDESSASASEILAGAIQDNDRGTIIGRRTFGKGLVQIPIEFNDGSMLRLTKARYYTPSGRCVQKPYTPGDEEEYEQDLILRAEHGEYYSQDSIKTSGEKYKTYLGRTVYGGGGIIPDVFTPRDTTGINSYFKDVYLSGMMSRFSYYFVDSNRKSLAAVRSIDDMLKFLKKKNLVETFVKYAEKNGQKRRNLLIKESHKLLETYLTSNIIDDFLGAKASAEYANRTDPAMLRALELFKRGEVFPKPPTISLAKGRTAMLTPAAGRGNSSLVSLATSPFQIPRTIFAICKRSKKYAAASKA